MRFSNVHERFIPGNAEEASALVDSLASEDDALWPRTWPRIHLDGGLRVGAAGGHGPIRYSVETYAPGRSVTFRFDPVTGFGGRHWLELAPREDGVWLRHVVSGESGLLGGLYWTFIARHLHDALMEDAFDNAERALTGDVNEPARWSLRVRALRAVLRRLGR